jgi:hypothetical protein
MKSLIYAREDATRDYMSRSLLAAACFLPLATAAGWTARHAKCERHFPLPPSSFVSRSSLARSSSLVLALFFCFALLTRSFFLCAVFHPPPPPPLDAWSETLVAVAANAHGLNGSIFQDHAIDGGALHEMERAYRQSAQMPMVVDTATDKEGPKLRFLRTLRKWAAAAEAPAPLRPPSPPAHPQQPTRQV